MAYSDIYSNRLQPAIINNIEVACAVAAKAILTEDPGVTNHENRVIWANEVLFDGFSAMKAQQMSWYLVLSSDGIQFGKGIPDDKLQSIVNDLVNFVALGLPK